MLISMISMSWEMKLVGKYILQALEALRTKSADLKIVFLAEVSQWSWKAHQRKTERNMLLK
jgi:hypothetical protein